MPFATVIVVSTKSTITNPDAVGFDEITQIGVNKLFVGNVLAFGVPGYPQFGTDGASTHAYKKISATPAFVSIGTCLINLKRMRSTVCAMGALFARLFLT